MNEMQFLVEISASKGEVWRTLWDDETFREWAGIIDPGTYMSGELKEGNQVEFISSENGYGVTSLVDKCIKNEFVLLKHQADTQEAGTKEREAEWTGGKESYLLEEHNGMTTFTTAFDVPSEMEEYFKETYPKALNRIKELAEK